MDRFDEFVKKGVYNYIPMLPKRRNSLANQEPYKQIELSFDRFKDFLTDLRNNPILIPIVLSIYDEGNNISKLDNLKRCHLLQVLNQLNVKDISFTLSDSTLPIYNGIMDNLNWKHEDVTLLKMEIDRNPVDIRGRDLKLEKAKGKIDMTEEQLIWQPDFVLSELYGKVDSKILKDTDTLKLFVRDFYENIDRSYYSNHLNDFDKIWIAYKYIRENISYAGECTSRDVNGNLILNPSTEKWESNPCGTLIHKRGVCKGQARLLRVLLNNYFAELDSVTICGEYRTRTQSINRVEQHAWGGTVINGKLYQYCTTMDKFMTPLNVGAISYVPDNDEIYPSVYPIESLNQIQTSQIKAHVKSLKR